ncbi:MAG TPA: hypothetical protein VJG90_07610 [Candidatus Nanoarchaeia archaeon]|nr:hypothetical protein [Candidatus Nanoarchaeia archaeon]
MDDLLPLFKRALQDNPTYEEALEIVRKNSTGKIWIIGGFVARNIAYQLYGHPEPNSDFDFIV